MKYIINYDKIKLRKEKNGTYSFLNTITGKIVFLNKVASFIYLNNEINNLDALIECVMNHFDTPSREKVEQDCRNALYIMSSLELLTIEEDDLIIPIEGCHIAGEGDYKKISDYIINSFRTKKNVMFYSGKDLYYYSHHSIRTRQFNNKEYNFIYYNNKKEIVALLSLGVVTASTYILLNVFANKDNIDKIKELINYAFTITPNLNKIRIAISSDNTNNEMKSYAQMFGFKIEAILEKEISKNIDLLNYVVFREN